MRIMMCLFSGWTVLGPLQTIRKDWQTGTAVVKENPGRLSNPYTTACTFLTTGS